MPSLRWCADLALRLQSDTLRLKAGIVDLTDDDRATIYDVLLWMADKLESEDGERARGVWTKLRNMSFEVEQADAHDRTPPPQKRT